MLQDWTRSDLPILYGRRMRLRWYRARSCWRNCLQGRSIRTRAAYLGLSHADLVAAEGEAAAAQAYARYGRQCFHPVPTLRRILETVRPALVVATNAPRAEQAALEAAGQLGIPAVCLVDLFAVDEKRWIARPGYAQRVCVLNEAVRRMFIAQGRRADEIVVTGNPAFDGLFDPALREAAAAVRTRLRLRGRKLLLYAPSPEPLHHPVREQAGDPLLPQKVLDELAAWVAGRDDTVLAVRPHPSQAGQLRVPQGDRLRLTGQDWPLEPLLHASDAVCITVSTVGLQAWLIGKPVVQVPGSMFDDGAPFAPMGMAQRAAMGEIGPALAQALAAGAGAGSAGEPATPRVVAVLAETANL